MQKNKPHCTETLGNKNKKEIKEKRYQKLLLIDLKCCLHVDERPKLKQPCLPRISVCGFTVFSQSYQRRRRLTPRVHVDAKVHISEERLLTVIAEVHTCSGTNVTQLT